MGEFQHKEQEDDTDPRVGPSRPCVEPTGSTAEQPPGAVSAATRTYWLSFVDPDRPAGQRFLGVAIVDVTADDAAAAKAEIDRRFPQHVEGAEWIAAATRHAWARGCNPGGEVGTFDITDLISPAPLVKDRLLSLAELEALGLQPVSEAPESPTAAGAVDPSAADPGTPTPRGDAS